MKLLHYTYRNLFFLLLLLMTLWGVLFYFAIIEEVTDETDDALENYRNILVNSALTDPSVLESEGTLMTFYNFSPISAQEAENYRERFYNSTVYIEMEDEDEPVRVMKSCFMMPDGQYYELEVMISTLEREDMIEAILGYLLALYLLLLLCFIVTVRFVLKRSFRPLDRLLLWLRSVQPGKEVPPLENNTHIAEFKELGKAAVDMSNRSYKAYRDQKQFIENASHELQTPLAILRGKVELLAESEGLSEYQMKELDEIYNTLGRAVKLNKSLLLLSRIENKQYTETEEVAFNQVIDNVLPDLMDIYEWKHIRVECHDEGAFVARCNNSLSQILMSNLLKNALSHTAENGELSVQISERSVIIKNSGECSLDTERIFQRFYHSHGEKKDSTGLGLAIAKSIANSYGLELVYSWDNGMHCFTISK